MASPAPDSATQLTPRGRTRNGTGASGPVRKALGPQLVTALEGLCGRPTIGLVDVGQDLFAIAAAAFLGHVIGDVVGPVLAVCYIGVRQRQDRKTHV